MKKIAFKPSKPVSFIGTIGGLTLSVFGFLYAIPNLGIFGIIWTVLAVLVTLYYVINLFSKKGLALYKMEVEDEKKKKTK